MISRLAALLAALALPAGLAAAAPAPRLVLPLDLESAGRVLFVADGGRNQVLRYDLRTRRLTVLAGSGVRGFAGDGGPARRARLDEVAGLARDRAGNLYVADLGNDRVRRIAPNGVISTVARVRAAVSVALDPAHRYLAIASIENRIHRLELATGRLEVLAGDGTTASTGDGGPAAAAQVDNPHSVVYDRRGNLLVGEQDVLRRIDGETGAISTLRRGSAHKLEVAPNGAVYVLNGSPDGGTVDRVEPSGRLVRIVGTGRLTPHRDRQDARRAGVLPTDLEVLADGTLLLAQSKPVPAIRRVAGGRLTTVLR